LYSFEVSQNQFLSGQALLRSCDAKCKPRSLMYNAVCLEFKRNAVSIRFHARLGKPSQISKVPPFLWEVLMSATTTSFITKDSKRVDFALTFG